MVVALVGVLAAAAAAAARLSRQMTTTGTTHVVAEAVDQQQHLAFPRTEVDVEQQAPTEEHSTVVVVVAGHSASDHRGKRPVSRQQLDNDDSLRFYFPKNLP